jgi:hypothetical protein
VVVSQKVIAPVPSGDELEILLHRPEVVSEMKIAGRLNSGKHYEVF